ncbi:MAG TPA: hypothetical protein PKG95_02665 [Anaerolineaceae bacterium]|nr:hypothetical protein [Anaerolineaceae bacterium]
MAERPATFSFLIKNYGGLRVAIRRMVLRFAGSAAAGGLTAGFHIEMDPNFL